MHEKCMKLENKCKRKGKRILSALEEKNLAKELEENNKKFDLSLDWSNKEWVCLKTFWKGSWTRKNQVFKKTLYKIFDQSKIRFDWSNINRASIETNKGWPKILIAILIDQKKGLIDRNSGKNKFLKNTTILYRNSSKHWILWIKCMSIRWNVFQKQKFWTQFFQN